MLLLDGLSGGAVFNYQGNLDDFYAERRRDPSTGNPTREALQHHGLEWATDDPERPEVLTAEEVKD